MTYRTHLSLSVGNERRVSLLSKVTTPRWPASMFCPWTVSWSPVPQRNVTTETLDVVTRPYTSHHYSHGCQNTTCSWQTKLLIQPAHSNTHAVSRNKQTGFLVPTQVLKIEKIQKSPEIWLVIKVVKSVWPWKIKSPSESVLKDRFSTCSLPLMHYHQWTDVITSW